MPHGKRNDEIRRWVEMADEKIRSKTRNTPYLCL